MNSSNNNTLPPGLAKFFSKHFNTIELIFGIIFFFSLLLKFLAIPNSAPLIGISSTTLGLIYFVGGFLPPDGNEKSFFEIIAFKVLHISWSVEIVGLLFLIMNFPGALNMAGIGAAANLIALLLLIGVSMNNWSNRKSQALVRSLVILLLLLVTYMM